MDRISEAGDEDLMSVSSTGSATGQREESTKNDAVDKKQNRAVARLGFTVFFILLVVTFAASFSVYFYTSQQEEEGFEQHFHDQATKVVNTFAFNAKRRLEAMNGFSEQVTSHAINTNATFPMVTLPDFERRATNMLALSEIVAVLIFPIVTAEQREEWTAYSVANQGWIDEGLALQQTREEDDAGTLNHLQEQFDKGVDINKTDETVDTTTQVPPFIFKVKPGTTEAGYEDGPGPYAPIWTFAPAIPAWNLVNFNSFSHPTRARELAALVKNPTPLLSSAADFRNDDPLTANRKSVMNLFLNRWKNGTFEYEAGPVSDIYIPIYDNFGPDRKMAQVMAAYIYWQSYFTNVLPQGQNGVVAILENSCGQSFTYVLNGPNVYYVGKGDLHESRFDDWVVETGYGAFLGKDAISGESGDAQCFYNVRVYPSSEMEDDYLTISPIVFACGLVSVFLLTSLVFLVFFRKVNRRHSTIETKAIKSSAVVQSLFPEKVRERLYENGPTMEKKKDSGGFRSGQTQIFPDSMHRIVDDTMPIADLHPECTVLFADISGFTKWSSIHTPAEVFKLLETLYATFDKIAKKRKVFKVETIGDCYVAVTGLPTPQDDHAIIMAKFAAQCLTQVGPVLHSLVDKLGPEVVDLSMRFGLNSGPVTAGVLRGEKARFQLFGDTVNTAARMESNGQSGRIHLSESTADLLIAVGMEKWVVAREDKIEAKGKRKLQTFWLTPEVDYSYTHKSSRSGANYGRGQTSSWADPEEDADRAMVSKAVGRLVKTSAHSDTRSFEDESSSSVGSFKVGRYNARSVEELSSSSDGFRPTHRVLDA